MRKNVILCADDFGAHERGDDAILGLVEAGRLSAVSCFTDSQAWQRAGPALCYRDSLLLGVHFNLTHPFGQGERPLSVWITRALTGRVDIGAVRAHLRRQVRRFMRVAGRLPDFIDGHQHIHAFPMIRSAVYDVMQSLRREGNVQLRMLEPSFGRTDAPWKRAVIRCLAATGAWPKVAAGVRLNDAFAGDYSFRSDVDYGSLFADWLAAAPDRSLIMCHPGGGASRAAGLDRPQEYDFLMSDRFTELLAAHEVELRADRIPPPSRLTIQERALE